jgi:hypothetical protein
MEEPHRNNATGVEVYRPLPPTPTTSLKMSSMEEESVRDRLRTSLLKQCSDILKADSATRFTRDAFRRTFQDKVGLLMERGPTQDSMGVPVPVSVQNGRRFYSVCTTAFGIFLSSAVSLHTRINI